MDTIHYDTDVNYAIHGRKPRPWGYEVRAAVFDDIGKHTHNVCITFKKEPSKEELNTAIEAKMASYKYLLDNPNPTPVERTVLTAEDAADFLIKRGYLSKGQGLEDIPDLTLATIEKPMWRKVWEYLMSPAGVGY